MSNPVVEVFSSSHDKKHFWHSISVLMIPKSLDEFEKMKGLLKKSISNSRSVLAKNGVVVSILSLSPQ